MRRHMSKPYLTTADRLFALVGIVSAAVPLVVWAVERV